MSLFLGGGVLSHYTTEVYRMASLIASVLLRKLSRTFKANDDIHQTVAVMWHPQACGYVSGLATSLSARMFWSSPLKENKLNAAPFFLRLTPLRLNPLPGLLMHLHTRD